VASLASAASASGLTVSVSRLPGFDVLWPPRVVQGVKAIENLRAN
jgi:hypothetical protein